MWLAPNEKFLPGDVKTFLANVHAEREKPNTKKIKDIGDNYSHYYEDLVYYEGSSSKSGTMVPSNRKRRNFEKDTSLEYIFELPIDSQSENWFLVTNEQLGEDLISFRWFHVLINFNFQKISLKMKRRSYTVRIQGMFQFTQS